MRFGPDMAFCVLQNRRSLTMGASAGTRIQSSLSFLLGFVFNLDVMRL